MTKKCKSCEEEKSNSEFYKHISNKDGLQNKCKSCVIIQQRERRSRTNYATEKQWAAKNREMLNAKKRETYDSEKNKKACKRFRSKNPSYARKYYKEWSKKNRVSVNLRKRFKRIMKTSAPRAHRLIGISKENFMDYLSNSFTEEMNWDNYGNVWTVDHILPLSSVDETDLEILFHYTNCRPTLIADNSAKNNKIIPSLLQPLLHDPNTPSRLKGLIQQAIDRESVSAQAR